MASDPGLSELGRRQAQTVADELALQLPPDCHLLSSPLQRALETAAPLALHFGQDLDQRDAFREIPAPVPLTERPAWLRRFMQQQWSEQEENLHAWRRTALHQLLQLDRPAAVFTHFLVINAVVGQVTGQAETLCFWPDNGSVTHLVHKGDSLELVSEGRQMQTVVN